MGARRRLVVIGGVAAGLSAAARARRLDPGLDIVVLERTGFCSYTACGLPYHVSGVVADHRDLVVRTPAHFAEQDIDVRVRHEVTAIDADERLVSTTDLDRGGNTRIAYDELVVATGASPVIPVAGADLAGCFTLRTVEDALAIRAWLAEHEPRHGVIVGGGYIGLEMAEALHARGVATTVVEREGQLLSLVDEDIADEIVGELERQGVAVVTGTKVEEIEGDDRVRRVRTDGGTLEADVVVLGVGVRPDSGLAGAAGLPLGPHGGVSTDAAMRTTVPGVWAAGDCCETRHLLHDEPAYIPLGTTANKQGRVVGANVCGGEEAFAGVVGTSVLRVCDLEVARTGLSVREAGAAGIDAAHATVTHKSRAAYYPGWQPITVKLVAERGSGRMLGAQLVGREGVAKRIDVVVAALHGGATVDDIAEFDLSYAPPFAPVWDPLLIAARQAQRVV